jgi:PhzF family phenazine biosynthesis protein
VWPLLGLLASAPAAWFVGLGYPRPMSEDQHRALHQQNRKSWNAATRAHNAHKRDQAVWLREGGELLFDEDYALLGPLAGKSVLHLQCNSGQDTLCLARHGAELTGVDISDEAITFAHELARETGIPASFERADIYDWLPAAAAAGRRFDLVYASYGWCPWLSDLDAWARGIAELLRPGGALVVMEFHPFALQFDEQRRLAFDYFGARAGRVHTFAEGVGDYVGRSGPPLAPSGFVADEPEFRNPHACHEFVWTLADLFAALRGAGLELERFEEWPYSNGCRLFEDMVILDEGEGGDGRRFGLAPGQPSLPLMFGLRATKPAGIPMYVVDAFAAAPFAGNPAAVCVLDSALSEATMQAIAAENNLSETAFVQREGEGHAIRWFTPTTEVELCGHATLASAHVVLELLEPSREEVVFRSCSGPLRVRRDADEPGRLIMDFPANPPQPAELPPGLHEALGARPRELLAAGYWLARFDSEAEVRALRPDLAALARIGSGELIATAPADDPELDFVSRFFAPSLGIDEDPVTGSAHCALAPYWAERLAKQRLRARQISARGGELECAILGNRVELIGRCARFSTARITLPA